MKLTRPPMGWNTWNTFGENISESLIMEIADAMVSKGLRDAGYEYIVIDDCWAERKRDENGSLVPDHKKFPHGLKHLADYIHSKGMKFGIYSSCGPMTCQNYPGSFDHEFQDAKFFADNEIDFLKYDWCYHPTNMDGWTVYNRMKMALDATGRDILFSICNWGDEDSPSWVHSVGGDMFRSTGDICDSFESIKNIYRMQMNQFALSTPTCYNDIDMLVCDLHGKGTVGTDNTPDDTEYKTHFALWCMLGAPLMLGCDVRNLSDEALSYLTNKNLLSIDQDPEGRPPMLSYKNREGNPTMFKHLADGKYALAITNFADGEVGSWVGIALTEFGFAYNDGYALKLTDAFTNEYVGTFRDYVMPGGMKKHETKVYLAEMVKV